MIAPNGRGPRIGTQFRSEDSAPAARRVVDAKDLADASRDHGVATWEPRVGHFAAMRAVADFWRGPTAKAERVEKMRELVDVLEELANDRAITFHARVGDRFSQDMRQGYLAARRALMEAIERAEERS
ncbi:hypothetical protein BI49514_02403 [Brevibacterium iodinum ATCC 49514]|uniref:Uncharacterized protein n=1 Tax=Brevibacterium iodinum ATCC 49514 TaxID=1255616 RepID=A0A2H1JVX8_9MICO|nr:hypothetical protein [Brevibacterium iodinum]SMX91464.1 hypothetical protein BI49514_02403 [Brevibacterium iodinum ATCC 49514]SUW70163.1 Uncharacterised protein [Brevibacterium iodinum]